MPGWPILRPGACYTLDAIGSKFVYPTQRDAQKAIEALGIADRAMPFPVPDEMPEGDAVLLVSRWGEGCDEH